jgi:hypothetical protein
MFKPTKFKVDYLHSKPGVRSGTRSTAAGTVAGDLRAIASDIAVNQWLSKKHTNEGIEITRLEWLS